MDEVMSSGRLGVTVQQWVILLKIIVFNGRFVRDVRMGMAVIVRW